MNTGKTKWASGLVDGSYFAALSCALLCFEPGKLCSSLCLFYVVRQRVFYSFSNLRMYSDEYRLVVFTTIILCLCTTVQDSGYAIYSTVTGCWVGVLQDCVRLVCKNDRNAHLRETVPRGRGKRVLIC